MVQRRPHNTLPIHHASSPRHRARRRAYLDAALKLGVALLALRGLASLRPARPVDDDAPLAGSAREKKRTKKQTRSAHFAIPAAASHLVVVAGHAVTMGEDLSAVARTDRDWRGGRAESPGVRSLQDSGEQAVASIPRMPRVDAAASRRSQHRRGRRHGSSARRDRGDGRPSRPVRERPPRHKHRPGPSFVH